MKISLTSSILAGKKGLESWRWWAAFMRWKANLQVAETRRFSQTQSSLLVLDGEPKGT